MDCRRQVCSAEEAAANECGRVWTMRGWRKVGWKAGAGERVWLTQQRYRSSRGTAAGAGLGIPISSSCTGRWRGGVPQAPSSEAAMQVEVIAGAFGGASRGGQADHRLGPLGFAYDPMMSSVLLCNQP